MNVGETFDRYRIEALLGEGGMGQVFRAFDTKLHRQVALKVLRTGEGSLQPMTGEHIARMLREARAAAALSHPNTIAIYDVGENDGTAFIAMEYIVGRSLREIIKTQNVSIATKKAWLVSVARALEAAHNAGIVHRDIKPENIMVRDDGVVKVLDFGIARRARDTKVEPKDPVSGETSLPTLTQEGALVGTPAYMSPEQIRAIELDGRSDQFSWGVLAFELFTGKIPWKPAQDALKMMAHVMTEQPKSLDDIIPETAGDICRTVNRALQKDTSQRFADMTELLLSFEGELVLDPGSESQRPSSKRYSAETRLQETLPTPGVTTVKNNPIDSATLGAISGTLGAEKILPAASNRAATVKSERSIKRKRVRYTVLAFGVSTVLLALVLSSQFIGMQSDRSAPKPSAEQAIPSSSTHQRKVRLIDLPPAPDCSAEAVKSVSEGLRYMWRAHWENAHKHFEEAVKQDPRCATAHLRLAMTGFFYLDSVARREHFRFAVEEQQHLTTRDQRLLGAFDPVVMGVNLDAFWTNATALAEQDTQDAEYQALAPLFAGPQAKLQHMDELMRLAQRALLVDPDYLDVLQFQYRNAPIEPLNPSTLNSINHCLKLSPSSGDCFEDKIAWYQWAGKCSEALETGEEFVTRLPTESLAYESYVRTLLPNLMAADAFDQILERLHARLPENERVLVSLYAKGLRAAALGDFDAVLDFAADIEKKLVGNEAAEAHMLSVGLQVGVYEERGLRTKTHSVLSTYFTRRPAWANGRGHLANWAHPHYSEDYWLSVLESATPAPPDLRLWKQAREKRMGFYHRRNFTLFQAVGDFLVLPKLEATDLLTESVQKVQYTLNLPAAPFPPLNGRVLVAQGKVGEGLEWIEKFANSCFDLISPFWFPRTLLWVGQAKEQQGEKAAACEAYEKVIHRWGAPKTKSVTAAEAKKRVKALGCTP